MASDKKAVWEKYVPVFVLLFGSGIVATVFTWWNKADKATLSYVAFTYKWIDKWSYQVIPGLSCSIGKDPVDSMYINTVQVTTYEGPDVEDVMIGIGFPNETKFYGAEYSNLNGTLVPQCTRAGWVFRCKLPLASKDNPLPYQIAFTTNYQGVPVVDGAGKSYQLMSYEDYASRPSNRWKKYATIVLSAFVFLLAVAGVQAIVIEQRKKKRKRQSDRGMLEGAAGGEESSWFY